MTGESSRKLGAREGWDVILGDDDVVFPASGGMSVAPDDPRHLLEHRRPVESGGSGKDPVWVIDAVDLPADLVYTPDDANPDRHGFVEPAVVMPFTVYQDLLAETREMWTLVVE